MSPISIVPLMILAAWAGIAPGGASLELIPEPIVTRQTVFTVPFRIDGAQESGQEPSEVQLYTSTDRGQSWRLYSKVGPKQGYFLFRAMGDGEFWFCVRTMDHFGTIRPEGNRPELRVIVDTARPHLEVRARRGGAGQVITQWDVQDAQLRPDNVSVQYRMANDTTWQSVAVNEQSYTVRGQTQTGEVSWWPNATSGIVQIRVEVADAAGNPAVFHAQVNLDPPPEKETPATADASKTDSPRAATATTSTSRTTSADDDSAWRPAMGKRPEPPATGASPMGSGSSPLRPGNSPLRPNVESGAVGSQEPYRPGSTQGALTSAESIPSRPSGTPVAAGFNPAIGSQYLPPGDARSERSTPYPPGIQPRMLNARSFELEYDVSAVGPWGIGRVELWGTSDGGRSWKSFGVDEDKKSPITVSLNEEGLYGFRVAVQSTAGLGGEAPRPGDPAQIWIGADWTKPQGRIVDARQGLGEAASQLTIEWESSDAQLAERPVSLFYSATPQGPWTLIAKGLAAKGRHYWSIDNRLTERVFLRLEVVDAAGNQGEFNLPDPVVLQRFVPAVQIRGVRPLSGAR